MFEISQTKQKSERDASLLDTTPHVSTIQTSTQIIPFQRSKSSRFKDSNIHVSTISWILYLIEGNLGRLHRSASLYNVFPRFSTDEQ